MKQIALIITISFLFFGNNTHTMHQEATSCWQKDLAFCALVGFGVSLGLSYLGNYIFTNNKKFPNQTQNANQYPAEEILSEIRKGHKEEEERHRKIQESNTWIKKGDTNYRVPKEEM